MRLLITGASGLLGVNLALEASRFHEVVGVDRNPLVSAPFTVIQADLLEAGAIVRVMTEARPEALIHCAAMADMDTCERNPELAREVNTELPAQLADICARRKIRLVHISTDAVFDGQKAGVYAETDEANPRGVYATTKYEAEKAVLQVNPQALVARVNFYGWSRSGKRSLAEFFLNNLRAGRTVNGFTDVTFCPMLANQLAETLIMMLVRGLHGVYHVVGPQAMTKYQFGVEIARKFGLNEALISPQSVDKSSLAARRSHNLWLSTHKVSTELQVALPSFSTGLDRFYAQDGEGYPLKIRNYQQEGG